MKQQNNKEKIANDKMNKKFSLAMTGMEKVVQVFIPGIER